jgi:DNA-directed RNA polymerase subunit M/transcription elongation factor TFIIS
MNLKINYTSNISGILTVNDYSKQDEKFDDVKYQVDKEIDVSDEYVQEQKNNQNQLIMDESINDFMMHDVDPLTGDFYDSNYDQIRRDKVIFLMQLFTPYEKFKQMPYRQKNLFIKQFERKIYNVAIEKAIEQNIINSWSIREFVLIYHMISYKLTANIDNNWLVNNTSLTDQILNKSVDVYELLQKSNVDLFPAKYEDIKRRIEISKNVEQTVKYSTLYVCKFCKGNKSKYEILQNRSADEGNNYTVTCLTCGHQFHA